MSRAELITAQLKRLYEKDDAIKACMVAKRGLEGLLMFPETFRQDVASIWEPLSRNVNDMLYLVNRYGNVGLNRMYTDILEYGAAFTVLSMSDTALIVFLKGQDTLEDTVRLTKDMQAARDEILKLLEKGE